MLPFLAPSMMAGGRFSVAQTDVRSGEASSGFTFSSVNFGPAAASRFVVVMAWHGDTSSDPGTAPTCQIAGSAATRIIADSDGTGTGAAIGTAIFTRALASGESGTVSVSWGGVTIRGIVVLRVLGYAMGGAHQTKTDSAGASAVINIPAKGLLLAVSGRRLPDTNAVGFSGVTRRGSDIAASARRNWGWSALLPAATGHPVSFSPFSNTNGHQSYVLASFAPL